MEEENDLVFNYLDNYEVEKIQICKLVNKYDKLFKKISKKIEKQAKKHPMHRWFEININDYTPKQMAAIKRYFCDWCNFGFAKSTPKNEMYKNKICVTQGIVENVSSYSTTCYTTDLENSPIEKFYITWFDQN